MAIPGAVLGQFREITLGTADDKHYTLSVTPLHRAALAIIGIPHLGFRARARFILRQMQNVPKGARILDAGAGYGIYSLMLAEAGYDVDALEIEAERVAALDRLLDERPTLKRRIRTIQGSLTELPMESGIYDAIICSDVIEHIADDASALREIARVLKPGGMLLLTVPHDSANSRAIYRMFGHERPGYSEAALRSLAELHGLELAASAPYTYEYAFGDKLFKLHNRLKSPALMAAAFYPFYILYLLDGALGIGEPNGIGFRFRKAP